MTIVPPGERILLGLDDTPTKRYGPHVEGAGTLDPTRPFVRLSYTVTRAQTHDKCVDALRRNPDLLAAIVKNPGAALDGSLILATKALR